MSESVHTSANSTMPRVSCVCPTTPARSKWLPKAIDCVLSQTWDHSELVIVADGSWTANPAALAALGSRILIVHECDEGMSIGAKRNIGNLAASGEIIIHWDDDDFSYPSRIADQVDRLLATGKAVTGYHSMRFTDGEKWWKYKGTPEFAFDTSLCYRKSFWERHPFDDINDGLEAGFRAAAIREKTFVSVDGSEMMHATIHPGNTGPRVMNPGNTTWEELAHA